MNGSEGMQEVASLDWFRVGDGEIFSAYGWTRAFLHHCGYEARTTPTVPLTVESARRRNLNRGSLLKGALLWL